MSTADAPWPTAPDVAGPPARLLLVRAPYYKDVVDGMSWGAARILEEAGATHDTLSVAGSFELPQAIRIVLRGPEKYDGFVALGCIVRGGTDHYDYICRETIAGLMQVALQFGIALGSGVLTVHSIEQAVARSRRDGFNKGAEAAVAALLQINAARRFGAA
ncbi:MAG TPA: 6,7-dimethyl-8-ribityllumazine synthase [Acetobacteraceae bacterium]|nr:6,7-dimethyl-8-ribityllumazine synthase [Acetobacteraceae bacterium]